jgi:hypothetical protein
VLTSIEFGIDTTLRIGALCYLVLPGPALLLARRGVQELSADPVRPS